MSDIVKYYPVMLNLKSQLVVVIGAGKVAYRKLIDLIEAEANIVVIAPKIINEIKELARQLENLNLKIKNYEVGDLKKAKLVFCTTNNSDVNKKVYQEASDNNIFINSADDLDNCSFILPAIVRAGDLIIAVSTSGASPTMAVNLKKEIASNLSTNIEQKLNIMRKVRERLKEKDFCSLNQQERSEFLKSIVNDETIIEKLLKAESNNSLDEYLIENLSIISQNKV